MTKSRILLVDDEETLRRNLTEVLQDEGYEVVAHGDGLSALKTLKTSLVDAMITDLRLPGLTGMELIDHAFRLNPKMVIVVMTAFGEVETAVQAMKRGVCDFVSKPFIFDEFIFRLKRAMNNEMTRRGPGAWNANETGPRGLSAVLDASVPHGQADLTAGAGDEVDKGSIWNLREAVRAFERQHVVSALEHFHNDKVETARALGIGVSSLYRKIDEIGLGKQPE